MLEITASTGSAPRGGPHGRTAPPSTSRPVTSSPVRRSQPCSAASLASAVATARVPPTGYQTPSATCIWAMAQSTAGEPYGLEPTYWVKWSSIWARRPSLTRARIVPATVLPMRSESTSRRVDGLRLALRSKVSNMSSTGFQKKKRSDTSCRCWARSRKRR